MEKKFIRNPVAKSLEFKIFKSKVVKDKTKYDRKKNNERREYKEISNAKENSIT